MVTTFGLIYIIAFSCMIIFLLTKKELKSQNMIAGSGKEKNLHSLNLVSFGWFISLTFIILFTLFLLLFITPIHLREPAIDFFNESLSFNPIFSLFTSSISTIALIIVGRNLDPRASYVPSTSIKGMVLWALMSLTLIVGILGILVGLFI